MYMKSGIPCFAFAKRAASSIKQHVKRYYAYPTQFYGYRQQDHLVHQIKNFGLLSGKTRSTNYCYGNSKQFRSLSTTISTRLLIDHNIGQFEKQSSCHQQHNILRVHCFCTSQQQNPKTSPASVNEHWGPYLVSRIHSLEESSRFHGYSILRWGMSVFVAILAGVYLFRDKLRDNVADEVADVASRSMADENVILKAHDMTKGVLERLASEDDTIALVSEFLKAVLQQNEVKNTAVAFATSVLNHPQTQEKLQEVTRNTLHSILNNQETKELLLEFIKTLIEGPQTRETCNLFLQSLTKDPDIQKLVSEFFKSVLASPTLQMEAVLLGREVTNKVVLDKDIQRQTGDALWSAMKYGVTPYWFRGEK